MSFSSAKLRRRSKPSTSSLRHPPITDTPPHPQEPSFTPTSHTLIESQLIPQQRRGYGTRGKVHYAREELLVLPNRQAFTQLPSHSHRPHHDTNDSPSPISDDSIIFASVPEVDHMDQIFVTASEAEPPELRKQRQQRKKERQWAKWANEVIPSLIKPHLQLLRQSQSLRELSQLRHTVLSPLSCHCAKRTKLTVTCVYFERALLTLHTAITLLLTPVIDLQAIQMYTCACSPAALQLLSRGLFPCAPTAPTLAVDLNMLDLVRELFLRVPPNTTAWSETLESFLGQRRYKLTTKVSSFQNMSGSDH